MLVDKKLQGKIAHLDRTYDALRWMEVAALSMEIAETTAHFRGVPPEDAGLEWRPAPPGECWGDSWWTAWFCGVVQIPLCCAGKPVYLRAQTGAPECQLLVDGVHRGSFDINHPVRLMDLGGMPGKTYQIHLEAYAGHTFPGTQPFDPPRTLNDGASPDDAKQVGPKARRFEGVSLVMERPEVSRFVFALRALRQLAEALDEHSLRRGRIQVALEKVFTLVYAKPADVPESQWRPRLAEAIAVMQPLLALQNGPTAPHFGIIGHSHIDSAWLWTLAETDRKLARTFSSVLSLMDQYPEFRFTQSAAYHSDRVRQLYPELFARIQERVKEGRWEINGAMWIEPDCNIPSGESFVRQCLVGQRATREMFGVTSDTLWQPDVFGYSAALPQILQKSGVRYFCTTKLGWNDTNHFPYDSFVWQGMDGSTVLSHFNRIHCTPDPETLIGAWKQVQHKDVQDSRLIAFGWGDGGGGPTAEMIEMGRLTQDLEGCPRASYQSITEFMNRLNESADRLPRWVGELYLELHRGTLTSISPLKRLNRACEFALRAAEFAATLAQLTGAQSYPADTLLELWKIVLLNQFHDILPGSSIAEVNDQAITSFNNALIRTNAVRDTSLRALAHGSGGSGTTPRSVLLTNALSWPREGVLSLAGLPDGMRPASASAIQEIVDIDGLKCMLVDGLKLPSLGYLSVDLTSGVTPPPTRSPFRVTENLVETLHARVRWNDAGQIISFFDRAARRELVAPGGAFNTFLLGEDVPAAWDSWDIDRDQRLKLAPQRDLIRRTVVADGPLQLRIRQEYHIGRESRLVQDTVFHAHSPQIDFETAVEWREKYQFLKVEFTLDLLTDSARHEIQFGHLIRTAHDNTSYDRAQFDVCAHKWTDISETGYGVAFLNDSKYACTVKGNVYRLSLLKSGRHPDARGDEGRHRFAYALLPHTGGFSVASVVRPAYEFNMPVNALAVSSPAAPPFHLLEVDAPNVIVEAVKWSEDGDGVILRLYEAERTGTHARLKFGVPVASLVETDLLEETPKGVALDGNTASLYFRPFEIKTLRCRLSAPNR